MDTISSLVHVSLFSGLSEQHLAHVCQIAQKEDFKKNEMILFEDEPDSRLYIILEGSVKLTMNSEDGREFIFSFLGEGDFFGELSILDDEIRSTNVVAVENTTLLCIQRDKYQDIFWCFPNVMLNLLSEMTQRLRKRDTHIKSLSFRNATGKVASTILQFADDSGDIYKGQVEITRLPPHRDIANMVGTSRETISRAINWLARQGYLVKHQGRLIIKDYQNFRSSFY